MVSQVRRGTQVMELNEANCLSKWDDNGEWRRLHNRNLYLYLSPNIVRLIKFTRLRWPQLVARMEHDRRLSKMSTHKPQEGDF